jgi:ATP-dependent Clp protease ATP-binding subunit ClpA
VAYVTSALDSVKNPPEFRPTWVNIETVNIEKPFEKKDPVFQRYTQKARRVVHSARYMAGRVGSLEIDTEHLLLGLLKEDKRLAHRFLGSPWAAEEIWRTIQRTKPAREKISGPVEIPLSNSSKGVLALAAEEADLHSNQHICTEHLLLGLFATRNASPQRYCMSKAFVSHRVGKNYCEFLTMIRQSKSLLENAARGQRMSLSCKTGSDQ